MKLKYNARSNKGLAPIKLKNSETLKKHGRNNNNNPRSVSAARRRRKSVLAQWSGHCSSWGLGQESRARFAKFRLYNHTHLHVWLVARVACIIPGLHPEKTAEVRTTSRNRIFLLPFISMYYRRHYRPGSEVTRSEITKAIRLAACICWGVYSPRAIKLHAGQPNVLLISAPLLHGSSWSLPYCFLRNVQRKHQCDDKNA